MDYPAAVVDKAQQLEQLLIRIEQGEPIQRVCTELEVQADADHLSTLQVKYEAGGGSFEALLDGRYGHPQKAHSALRQWLYQRKHQDITLTAPQLVDEVKQQFGVDLSPGHINYLLRKVELTRPPGRPRCQRATEADPDVSQAASSSFDNAGLFFPRSRQARDGDSPNRN
jgi:transposase